MEDKRLLGDDSMNGAQMMVEPGVVSPLPPAASPAAPSANATSPPNIDHGPPGSPVMLATMTPVEFGKDYEEQTLSVAQSNLPPVGTDHTMVEKNVIYLESGTNSQGETVIYDASQPLPQGLSIQEANGPNGPISVVVQQPGAALSLNQAAYQAVPAYQGHPGTTVLVLSELVDDSLTLPGSR